MNSIFQVALLAVLIASFQVSNAAIPSDIKSVFSLSKKDGASSCPPTLQPLEYTDVGGYLRIYNSKLRAGTGLCATSQEFIPLLSAPIVEKELKRNSDLFRLTNRDRGFLKHLRRTHSIIGMNAYYNLVCGNTIFRKGTIMAFVRNKTEPVPELGLSDLLNGFTYLLMLETGVSSPKRCVYKTSAPKQDDSGTAATTQRIDCFPAHATVQLSTSQRSIRMDQLEHGHAITDHGPVFAFSHRDPTSVASYIRFTADNGKTLMVSPGHYVFSAGKLRVAGSIRTGDYLDGQGAQKMRVVSIERNVRARGMFNPHTASGQLIVDGFRVSCYTRAVHPYLAHKLLLPVRMLYQFAGSVAPLRWLHKESSFRRLVGFLPKGPLALEWQ